MLCVCVCISSILYLFVFFSCHRANKTNMYNVLCALWAVVLKFEAIQAFFFSMLTLIYTNIHSIIIIGSTVLSIRCSFLNGFVARLHLKASRTSWVKEMKLSTIFYSLVFVIRVVARIQLLKLLLLHNIIDAKVHMLSSFICSSIFTLKHNTRWK